MGWSRLAWLDPDRRTRLIRLAAGIFVAIYITAPVAYPFHIGWCDQVEPSIGMNANLLVHGNPLYHAADSPSRYALPYGPGAFLFVAASQAILGPSMTSTKLPGVAFALATPAILYLALRRSTPAVEARALGLLFFCGMALAFRCVVYWARGDPQLLFWASCSVFSFTIRPPTLRLTLCGLCLGALCLAKIHGTLFAVPAVVLALTQAPVRTWLVLPAVAVGVVAAPFVCFAAIDFPVYLGWLKATSQHGLGYGVQLIVGVACLVAAPVLLLVRRYWAVQSTDQRRALVGRYGAFAVATAASIGGVGVFASKAGAGWHHLLPFLPLAAYLLAVVWAELPPGSVANDVLLKFAGLLYVPIFLLFAVPVLSFAIKTAGRSSGEEQENRAALDELHEIVRRRPSQAIAMGYAGENTYLLTLQRTSLPYQNDLVLEGCPLMDMQAAGMEIPSSTLAAIGRGGVPVWVIPRGEKPFTLPNFVYPPHREVFGEDFRRTFADNYRLVESGKYYDTWIYQPNRGREPQE